MWRTFATVFATERFVKPATLKIVAGLGFIIIGLWTLISR